MLEGHNSGNNIMDSRGLKVLQAQAASIPFYGSTVSSPLYTDNLYLPAEVSPLPSSSPPRLAFRIPSSKSDFLGQGAISPILKLESRGRRVLPNFVIFVIFVDADVPALAFAMSRDSVDLVPEFSLEWDVCFAKCCDRYDCSVYVISIV